MTEQARKPPFHGAPHRPTRRNSPIKDFLDREHVRSGELRHQARRGAVVLGTRAPAYQRRLRKDREEGCSCRCPPSICSAEPARSRTRKANRHERREGDTSALSQLSDRTQGFAAKADSVAPHHSRRHAGTMAIARERILAPSTFDLRPSTFALRPTGACDGRPMQGLTCSRSGVHHRLLVRHVSLRPLRYFTGDGLTGGAVSLKGLAREVMSDLPFRLSRTKPLLPGVRLKALRSAMSNRRSRRAGRSVIAERILPCLQRR